MDRDVIVLTGPTAVGKSALALPLAARLGAEIISMDSRQVYRGMDSGTAKPNAAERARIPHHGLDLVAPGERYSAGRFARDARGWLGGIRQRGRRALLVGGTGFFLRALTDPLFEEPPMEPHRRRRLRGYLAGLRDDELARWLRALDPVSARRLEGGGGGRQRRLRSLELALLTGRPLPWWHANRPGAVEPLQPMIFVIDLPRERLYDRINHRVGAMIEAGLVDEARGLIAAGHQPGEPGLSATGYPEVMAHLAGELTLEEAADRIRRATRRYARRQLTWLRHQLPEGAVWLDGSRSEPELVEEVWGWVSGS